MRGTDPLAPKSNWHRMLTMLALNGGTLYRAQMYRPKPNIMTIVDINGVQQYRSIPARDIHSYIDTGHMPKMTNVSAFAPLSYAYEHRAADMGLVAVTRFDNRKWITLLPKGRAVLAMLDAGIAWEPNGKINMESFR